MAQLSNDCFKKDQPLMTLDQALAHLRRVLTPQAGISKIDLMAAESRILASQLVADHAHPPFDNSAVDGYALSMPQDQMSGSVPFDIVGQAAAGHPYHGTLAKGQAIQIFTGASLPAGCDVIYMMEDISINPQTKQLVCPVGLKLGSNIRRAGEDIAIGDVLLEAGLKLTPAAIGLAASQGIDQLSVYQPLRVAVFSTGDEITPPNAPLMQGALYDMNRPMLVNWLKMLGYHVSDLGILKDDADGIQTALSDAAQNHDAILTSGGMSMGAEDHVKNAIEQLGSLQFWKLAIKPGRPIGLGLLPRGDSSCLFIGLPGNVVASYTTFALIGRIALKLIAGERILQAPSLMVEMAHPYKKKANRLEIARVKLNPDAKTGMPQAVIYQKSGAGILSSITNNDGFILLDEEKRQVDQGDKVRYIPFNEFYQ
ncbi:MAG: gephyrin-like molybdotransferase Glp [Alphaproteobacteria bacterium]